jgi:hypothetical protein
MATGRNLLAEEPQGRNLLAEDTVDLSVPTPEAMSFEKERQRQARMSDIEDKSSRGFVEKYIAPIAEVPAAVVTALPGAVQEQITGRYAGYVPKSRTSQEILGDIGSALEKSKLEGLLGVEFAGLGKGIKQAAQAPRLASAITNVGELPKILKTNLGEIPKITTKSKAEAAAKGLAKEITQAEQSASELAREKGTSRQVRLREAEESFLSAAQQQTEKTAREFAGFGDDVRINDNAKLGDEMQRRLVGTEFTRESRRSRAAANDFAAYFEDAKGFENSNQRQQMLQRLKAMSENPSAGSAGRKYARQAYQDLTESADALGAEKEFRKYFEQASAPQEVGFGAVEQQANRDVANIISNSLNNYAPKRIEARNTYAEFSTPLDAYETLFGRRAVATEKGVKGQVSMMPTDYPKYYFKNRDTINVLRQQLAGDEAAVRRFANQHFVNETRGMNAKQARSWYETNKGWVNSVEGLNNRIQRYVDNLAESEKRAGQLTEGAKKIAAKEKKVGVAQEETQEDIRNAITQIDELSKTKPENVAAKARTIVSDLKEKKLINEQQANEIERQIISVDKSYEGAEKTRRIRNYVLYVLAGSYATYTGSKLLLGL